MAFLKIAEGDFLQRDIPAVEALADVDVTNRFIKLAEQLKRIAPRSNDFTYFTAIFMHGAEASLVDLKTGEPKKDFSGKIITGGYDDKWQWTCSDSSIDPYSNANGDIFPSAELKKAHSKWVGRPLCVNHQSSDIEGVRGIIIDTHWDEKYKRIVGLCAIDSKTYPDLAHKVKSGYSSNVSMGSAVGQALCTACKKVAITEKDYCDCIRTRKGQRINGVKVGEINLDLNPIELSLVVTPADQQAKVLKIIASMNNYADQRNSLLEEKDRAGMDKLSQLDSSVKNVETQLNRLFSECSETSCQFVRGEDGHIRIIKSAQDTMSTWDEYFRLAHQVASSKADSAGKADLLRKMQELRSVLDVKELVGYEGPFLEVANLNDPELKAKQLSPLVVEYNAMRTKAIQPDIAAQPQFTSQTGPDSDLGISYDAEVHTTPAGHSTGERLSDINPSEVGIKPNNGGDLGPELGSASDKFQFGNIASRNDVGMLMAKGGKKTAELEENLTLLLKQTQDIEMEMNKMKETLNINNTMVENKTITNKESQMNDARLKLRSAKRHALLEKTADNKTAYWQGTEEPKPGKEQYKKDPQAAKSRGEDKFMHQDKSMGGADGSFPGDEADKKKLLRAELVPGTLRTKFTRVRNADGSFNKSASYFEVFSGGNKLLTATANEIYGNELDMEVPEMPGKTYWDVLSSQEYGKQVMAAIRQDGFKKVAYLLKGAQAAMPGMPAPDGAPAPAAPVGEPEAPAPKAEVDVKTVTELVERMEETLNELTTEVTGESGEDADAASVDIAPEQPAAGAEQQPAEMAGMELAAALKPVAREVYAELNQSADELALIVDCFKKSASLSTGNKAELKKVAEDAVADGIELLEEAETILAIAGKVPAGLAAYQAKQKGKGKKDDKKKDKKDDKKDKKKDKKAFILSELRKISQEIAFGGDSELGELEEEYGGEEAGELARVDADLDEVEAILDELENKDAGGSVACDGCGEAKDAGHCCTASAKDQLVIEALASRKARREQLLKQATEGYDVVPDTHGLVDEAHRGSEANPSTELDVKPAGKGAVVEGIDAVHDAMMDAATGTATGKQGSAALDAIKVALEADMRTKKAEEDKTKYRVKLRRAYDLGLMMQEKGMLARGKEALDSQVDEIIKFDDAAFESYKRSVANAQPINKVASVRVPSVGVREDNSGPGDNGGSTVTLGDQLNHLWK